MILSLLLLLESYTNDHNLVTQQNELVVYLPYQRNILLRFVYYKYDIELGTVHHRHQYLNEKQYILDSSE